MDQNGKEGMLSILKLCSTQSWVLERILASVSESSRVRHTSLFPSASFGIIVFPMPTRTLSGVGLHLGRMLSVLW